MKVRFACLSIGFAAGLALAASQPASAADMGGIKDYGGAGGVPVPAPVPIAISAAEWYIGIAAGGVLVDDSSIENFGSAMPVIENDKLNKTMFGGISAGRYLTPSLRAEIAFDFYDDFKVAGPNEVFYTDTKSAKGDTISVTQGTTSVTVQTYDTNHYVVERTDTVRVGRTTGMMNLFYDLDTGTRFRPYVGGGVGVSWRAMKRKASEIAVCEYTTNSHNTGLPTNSCSVNSDELPSRYTASGEYNTDRFDIALAAMAGFSIEVTPDIIWDNGYQMLWEGAGIEVSADTVSGVSTVSYSDTLQHHFRTGLRFNVN